MAHRAALPALIVLVGSLSGGCQLLPSNAPRAEAPLPRRVSALGRIEPLGGISKVSVPSSLSNDRVREILVSEGQRVEPGQPLAILESFDSLKATAQKSQASIAVAERKLRSQEAVIRRYRAELTQAKAEARRAKELFDAGATSANRYEAKQAEAESSAAKLQEALADRETLQAELVESRAALAKDQAELAKTTIRAPYGGTIFKLVAHAGDKVGEGGLLEMGDSSRMGVIAEIYQSDLPEIRPNQAVTISADGFPGHSVRGRVSAISRQVSRQSVTSGESGDNVDRRVVEVKIALPPEAIAKASRVNYLQVNVVFDPLSPEQRQQRPSQP
jgi:HlyD family secretion protein